MPELKELSSLMAAAGDQTKELLKNKAIMPFMRQMKVQLLILFNFTH